MNVGMGIFLKFPMPLEKWVQNTSTPLLYIRKAVSFLLNLVSFLSVPQFFSWQFIPIHEHAYRTGHVWLRDETCLCHLLRVEVVVLENEPYFFCGILNSVWSERERERGREGGEDYFYGD